MTKSVVIGDEAEELKRLMEIDLPRVSAERDKAIATYGMISEQFALADRAHSVVWCRIREIRGEFGPVI